MNTVIEFFGQVWCRLTGLQSQSQRKASQRKSTSRFGIAISNGLLLIMMLLFSGNTYAATPDSSGSCGGHGQAICPFPDYFPTCDSNHYESNFKCYSKSPNTYTNCGGNGQTICSLPIFPTCDSNLTQSGSICIDTNPNNNSSCGGGGQPICQLPIFPTCDTNITQSGSNCVDTNPNNNSGCGGLNQTICSLPIFPTCDTSLVQEGSICRDNNPNSHSSCGGNGQAICQLPIFPTCDTNLSQSGSICVDTNPNHNSSCGGNTQSICQLPIFPTCDTNMAQSGSICVDTNPNHNSNCGGNTQSICQLPVFPTCDTNLAQRLSDNTCQVTNPNLTSTCGGIGQSICALPTFPTCDTNLAQSGVICVETNPNSISNSNCGGATQSICELPIFPTCDTNLTQVGNKCADTNPNHDSSCGGSTQSICQLPIFPTCDTNLAQRLSDNTCQVTDPNLTSNCGGDTQPICELPVFPTCDTNVVQIGSNCFVPTSCGAAGQRACTIFPEDASRRADIGGRSCEAGTAEITGLPEGAQAFGSVSQCVAVTACGGDGQRACCGGDVKSGFSGGCASGLQEFPAVDSAENNLCGGLNTFEHESSGTCVAVTACGGDGQRACCSGAGEYAQGGVLASCESGLTESVGCTGDCSCGGISSEFKSNGTCTLPVVSVTEPTTNSESPVSSRENGLSGYADLHIHLHADLAHGKQVLVGQPAPTGPDGKFLLDSTHNITTALSASNDSDVHGSHDPLFGDPIGKGTQDNAAGNMGVPYFNNWPNWRTSTHQQMYFKWLERAYRGGLRLSVMFAVTNEALCRSTAPDGVDVDARCANSMIAIDEQLEAAKDFETFIDSQNGGAGKGWFRIVKTPEDARSVIAEGKMAVILGIEVDNIFNCKAKVIREDLDINGNVTKTTETGGCPDALTAGETEEEYITRKVNEYYELGVRHVFPVHNFDNAFGSPATWQDPINVGNRAVEGAYWQTEECPTTTGGDYGFKTSADFGAGFMSWITGVFGFGVNESIPVDLNSNTSCHVTGLNLGQGDRVQTINNALGNPLRRVTFKHDSLGDFLFNRLMDKGMIIDIDHLSIKSVDNTINIARQRSPHYPLVASHVQFFDLNQQSIRHERMRTREQLMAIRDDGGMIAAMLKDDQVDTDNSGKKFNTPYKWQTGAEVADDCRHSSKTYAQMYQYAVDIMGAPVAFGSDFNGVAGHVGPRFGSDGCGGRVDLLSAERDDRIDEKFEQMIADNRLVYPFTLPKPGFDTLSKQVTGKKTFDFNVDGLAHAGLLPDMIKDMQNVGMDAHYFDAMFNSAEQYVRVWERAENISRGDPVAVLDLKPAGPPADCVDVEVCYQEANPQDPNGTGTGTGTGDPTGTADEKSSGGSVSYWLIMLLGFAGLIRVFNVRRLVKE